MKGFSNTGDALEKLQQMAGSMVDKVLDEFVETQIEVEEEVTLSECVAYCKKLKRLRPDIAAVIFYVEEKELTNRGQVLRVSLNFLNQQDEPLCDSDEGMTLSKVYYTKVIDEELFDQLNGKQSIKFTF